MRDASASGLRELLRNVLPEAYRLDFDEDAATFADDDGRVDSCGLLTALGWSFDRLVRDQHARAIGAVLAAIESMFEQRSATNLHDSIVVCFFENVLPTTPRGHPLVIPQMGPLSIRAVDPHWLLPDGNARLSL